ncbi:MAG: glycoside hydrolase family 95 protein [Treponema sp.]|jgi:alpha-L-fucosidase 2|nr:glycoside hydrolase family 95 protein [Treponema sp.]
METKMISFATPARVWEEALPVGNGRLGAMIFGVSDREKLQLNEDSIWSGGYRDRNNPAAREALPFVRSLIRQGRIRAAEDLCIEAFTGIPPEQRVYQTAGELSIDFSTEGFFGHEGSGTRDGTLMEGVHNYQRILDLSRALHIVSFEWEGTVFTRECFASAPAGVIVLHCTVSIPGMLSFRVHLSRGIYAACVRSIGNDTIELLHTEGIPFCVAMKTFTKGGKTRVTGGFLTVEGADEAVLLIDARTGFRETDYEAVCLANLNRQFAVPWEQLLEEHIEDYQRFFNRLEFSLDVEGEKFTERYFNFCRYLLISASRPGTLPANLQGIWNKHIDPPWGSAYTININTQMNYWGAYTCNLAETEEPLFDLLERAYLHGKRTAEIMYGCRGFAAHHNMDLWGDTAPRDCWLPGSYGLLGLAWLVLHLWEHYEYTLDKAFIKRYFYLLHDTCLFFVDFLEEEESDNQFLIVNPSVSPENSYCFPMDSTQDKEACSLCTGCAMDNQILRRLFCVTIRAAELISIENENIAAFRSILSRLAEPRLDHDGCIAEWNEYFEEVEPGHRHLSHLWALFPGDSITLDETPALTVAARKSLEKRLANGGGGTGWSLAWTICLFAQLHNGEQALSYLNRLFNTSTLPNLFNIGPPFQIDGNFGAMAGLVLMLVQSRLRFQPDGKPFVIIDILPALPESWADGFLKGVRLRGSLSADIVWQNRRLASLILENKGRDIQANVRYTDMEQKFFLTKNCFLKVL